MTSVTSAVIAENITAYTISPVSPPKITLTESGRKVGDKLIWWATKIQSYLDSGIPREHLEIMYQTLDKLREGFERLNRDPQLGMGLFPDVQKTEVSGTDKE